MQRSFFVTYQIQDKLSNLPLQYLILHSTSVVVPGDCHGPAALAMTCFNWSLRRFQLRNILFTART